MEDTQDLIFEIEGNVGSVGSSDLLGVVSLVMTGGTEAFFRATDWKESKNCIQVLSTYNN